MSRILTESSQLDTVASAKDAAHRKPGLIREAGWIVTTPWFGWVSSLSLASLRRIRPWMTGDVDILKLS